MFSILLAAALCAGAALPPSTGPETQARVGYVCVSPVEGKGEPWIELREGPQANSPVIFNLGFADRKVYRHAVKLNGKRCYVHATVVRHGGVWTVHFVESVLNLIPIPEEPQPGNPA